MRDGSFRTSNPCRGGLWHGPLTVAKNGIFGLKWRHYGPKRVYFGVSGNTHILALSCLNSLTSNFNSLLFFERSQWPFYLDWFLEIWTDTGISLKPATKIKQILLTKLRWEMFVKPKGNWCPWVEHISKSF